MVLQLRRLSRWPGFLESSGKINLSTIIKLNFLSLSTCVTFYRSSRYDNISLICVIALVELATTLMCIAMHNFSFALFVGVIYVPVILYINPRQTVNSKLRKLLYVFWILLHPIVLVSLIVMISSFVNFFDEPVMAIVKKGFGATKTAFVYGIIDSMVYGNWLYNVIAAVFLPIWLLLSNVIARDTVTTS